MTAVVFCGSDAQIDGLLHYRLIGIGCALYISVRNGGR